MAGQLHEEQADDDGGRHGDRHDDGGADVDQEDEQDERAKQYGLPDACDGGIDGGLDVFGFVRNPGQFHAAGQGFLDFREAPPGFLHQRNDVAFGLLDDLEHDAAPAVEDGALAHFRGGHADGAEVAQLAAGAVAVGHLEVGDVGDVLVLGVEADGEFAALLADAAAGQVENAALERGDDVGRGEAGGGQAFAIEFHPHFAFVAADDLHFADAGNRGEAVGDDVVGVVVEVVDRRVAGEENIGDGRGVDVDFLNDGAIGIGRQFGEDRVNFFADILCGSVHIDGQIKLQDHLADVLQAGGLNVLEAIEAGDGVFDVLADVFFDVFRRSADPLGDDGDVGDVDGRHVLDGELAARVKAQRNQRNQQTTDGDGPAGGGIG
ncbi:MAG: hypothetical protein BWX54_01833 [Verrucomicrobia bacterium ADurb.Bin018]|nr:MAG: hypothetical protein BWX54_01833 [Verrucomicrobia bacterium ADurb.Bin018]